MACTVEGCGNAVLQRGLCGHHKYAEYLELQPETVRQIEQGLASWLVPDERGCWLFTNPKSLTSDGYGKFMPDGRWAYVHRWLYMDLVGPIPNGYHLHHECHVRNCARPGHLTPLSPRDHALQTAAHAEFLRMFPGELIVGPNRSHSDEERLFARALGLPADTTITDRELEGLRSEELFIS